jgi:putative ABC transport system permease protein
MGTALAWLQLARERLRLLVAVAGVAFAVILIFMQLGFQAALFDSSVRFHNRLNGEVFLISPQTSYLVNMTSFPRRRLYQALGFPGVESVSAVYASLAAWKNPDTGETRQIFVAGFDPSKSVFEMPGVKANSRAIRFPDAVLYDEAARPEFGPIAAEFKQGRRIETEVSNRHINVVGLFEMGTSFGIDGMLITSDLNFLRIFRNRNPGLIDIGVVRRTPRADPLAIRDSHAPPKPNHRNVLTKPDFIAHEQKYWGSTTPIGYVFTFGVIMGLIVGTIIVYQILFANVADHLAEYATLKAMGYTNAYLFGVVIQQALILEVLGFVPGVFISWYLYRLTADATHLPMQITLNMTLFVFGLTVVMCCVSGAIALRKIRSADPAEIF